jgi:hypothetical protein
MCSEIDHPQDMRSTYDPTPHQVRRSDCSFYGFFIREAIREKLENSGTIMRDIVDRLDLREAYLKVLRGE